MLNEQTRYSTKFVITYAAISSFIVTLAMGGSELIGISLPFLLRAAQNRVGITGVGACAAVAAVLVASNAAALRPARLSAARLSTAGVTMSLAIGAVWVALDAGLRRNSALPFVLGTMLLILIVASFASFSTGLALFVNVSPRATRVLGTAAGILSSPITAAILWTAWVESSWLNLWDLSAWNPSALMTASFMAIVAGIAARTRGHRGGALVLLDSVAAVSVVSAGLVDTQTQCLGTLLRPLSQDSSLDQLMARLVADRMLAIYGLLGGLTVVTAWAAALRLVGSQRATPGGENI